MNKQFEPLRAPARVLRVIHVLALSANGLSLARLADATSLPKTSLLNLLRSLEAFNYVVNVGGTYRLGGETHAVAAAVVAEKRFTSEIRLGLLELYEQFDETVQACVMAVDEPAAEVLDVIETSQPVRLNFPVGLRRPLYSSAAGKLLLAYQSEQWIDAYLKKQRLHPYTEHTVVSPAKLRKELLQIAAQGWCLSHQGMFVDSSGMAALIRNEEQGQLAALTLVAPTYRMERREAEIRDKVISVAGEINRRLADREPKR